MKKVCTILVFFLLMSVSVGCGKVSPEAKSVIDEIKAIEKLADIDEHAITNVENSYDKLTDEQKNEVRNYQTLVKVRDEFDAACAQSVIDEINALNITSVDDEGALVKVEDDYNNLSDSQKKKVSNYSLLQTARNDLDAMLALKPIPFSKVEWDMSPDEVKDLLNDKVDEEYDTDNTPSAVHVVQYNKVEYDGYSGLVRYCFEKNKLVEVLFYVDNFNPAMLKHFNDYFTNKYGSADFENEYGKVYYTDNSNIAVCGWDAFVPESSVSFRKPE